MKSIIFLFLVILSSCGSKFGKSVEEKGDKLYYVDPVTEAEARSVLKWLHEINHNFGIPPVPFQLGKKGEAYVFKYTVGIKGAENDEGNLGYLQTFASKLSEKVNNKKVEVHLTDEDLNTKRIIYSE